MTTDDDLGPRAGDVPSGRHRKPPNPRTLRRARLALVAGALVILVGLIFEVSRIVSGSGTAVTAPHPGSPSASSVIPADPATSGSSSPTPSGPGGLTTVDPTSGTSSTSATTDSTPSPTSSQTGSAPRVPAGVSSAVVGVARGQLDALADLREQGVHGAPVVGAPLGEKVLTAPGVVVGRWESTRLPNAMTLAANNERALRAGKVVVAPGLPTATGTTRLKLPSGERISVPVQSAKTTAEAMRSVGGPACPTCQDIVITSVKSTTMPVQTHLGTVTVPAWRFAVRGSKAALVEPAVGPTGLLRFSPPYRGSLATVVTNSQLPLWRVALAKDRRTVTASIEPKDVAKRGGCWRLVAQETPGAVALYATKAPADASGACADRSGRVAVRLAEPLSSRVPVDTYWRRALTLR